MPTLILFAFVFAMTALAYRMVYPVLAEDNLTRLMVCDCVLMLVIFAVVGARFHGSDTQFDFGLFEANWFLASLVCLFAAEAILLPAYLRRFKIFK